MEESHNDLEKIEEANKTLQLKASKQYLESQIKESIGFEDSYSSDSDDEDDDQRPLTRKEKASLCCCLLAWTCTAANVMLVIGTSNVILLSLGGSASMSALPLGAYFLGASFMSLMTPRLFKNGRKGGFLKGILIGLMGTGIGMASIFLKSPTVLIVATIFLGAAMVVGFALRFAAIEVVPFHFGPKAVTLVVSGGCIAAFAGPESSRATTGIFGEDLLYLGTFMMTGIFGITNAFFTYFIAFPKVLKSNANEISKSEVRSILRRHTFLIPVLVSAFSWAIMALPMSLFRVAAAEVGFPGEKTLLGIELHFFGMYAPGFFSGYLINKFGPRAMTVMALIIYFFSLLCCLLAPPASQGPIALWTLGLILVGMGWNFSFNSGTIWLVKSYSSKPAARPKIQATNDSLMFLFAGIWISCASFIYDAGGAGLSGWRTLITVVSWLVTILAIIIFADLATERKSDEEDDDIDSRIRSMSMRQLSRYSVNI